MEGIVDTWGFVIIGVSVILYFLTRKNHQKLAQWFLLTFGIGIGLVIGAVWAFSIVQSAFN
jgi:hypothetical protein